MKLKLLTLACLIAGAASGSAATAPLPTVVFIGDNLTYGWEQSAAFKAHTNWVGMGFTGYGPGSAGSGEALAELLQIIKQGQHPVVHLMVGQSDEDSASPGNQQAGLFEGFAYNIEQIVTLAQKNNIKLIIGTIPYALLGNVDTFNQWLFLYAGLHKVPIVNYHNVICQCTLTSPNNVSSLYSSPNPIPGGFLPGLNDAGYSVLSQMADLQIGLTAEGLTLKKGYLQNVGQNDLEDAQPMTNTNSVVDGSLILFTPFAQYSDGSTRPLLNQDVNNVTGVWVSSNPSVVSIDQSGNATAYSPGKANIYFAAPPGVGFSSWTMTVYAYDPCYGGCPGYPLPF